MAVDEIVAVADDDCLSTRCVQAQANVWTLKCNEKRVSKSISDCNAL